MLVRSRGVTFGLAAGRSAAAGAASAVAARLRRWPWPLVLPITVFLVSLGFALRAALRATDGRLVYALDDAYIHMAVARNLAASGLWGCTPFHFSSSSSSLLWTLLLGAVYRVFGVHDVAPLVLNVAFALATLAIADRQLSRLGAPALLRAVALFGIVVALPMPAMALMGMEHVLHGLLTIAFAAGAIEALTSAAAGARAGRRETVGLCVLGALVATSRYEGLFLVGLVCLGLLARGQLVRSVSVGAAAALPVAAFGVVSVLNGAFFLPNSLMLKAVGEKTSALSSLLKPIGPDDLEFLRTNPALPLLVALGLVAALVEWRAQRGFWRREVLFPLLVALLVLVHGHYVFSPTFWAYRYDAYLVAFGIFAGASVLAGRAAAWPPRGAGAAVALLALVLVVADVRQGLDPSGEVAGARHTYLEDYQSAQLVHRYYPDAAVVVNDLGAVTYYTRARILDAAALGDVEPLLIMRRTGGYTSADVLEWTSRHAPAIAIIQLGWGWIAPRIPAEWIKVAEIEVPPDRSRVGFFAADPKQFWILRSIVQQHYGPLVPSMGYRIKLRPPPPKLAEAAAAHGPGG